MKPRVEFFTEDIDDVAYMNVGLVWEREDEEVRAVLGAIKGDLNQDQMKIIAGIAEQACIYVLDLEGSPLRLPDEDEQAADVAADDGYDLGGEA